MDCIKDLQDAIRNILVNNGLTELCLGEPDELDDPTYIIWHANILEVRERDGKRRCPACGRTVKGKQRYCGAGCRDFMTPGPTVEQVAEKANRNIRKLASLAAGKDKAYRKRLIEKYTVGPS